MAKPQIEKHRETEDFPPILQARHIMELVGGCEAIAYQIMHHKDCSTVKMGKRMIVPRDDFGTFFIQHKGKSLC